MSRTRTATVRLPWLVGLVALLLVGLWLLVQPYSNVPSSASAAQAGARTAALAETVAADLVATSARLDALAATLPADATAADLEAALAAVGAEGLELSPGGPAAGVPVPALPEVLAGAGVRVVDGVPVMGVQAADGRSLRAVLPVTGLLPEGATVLGSRGETVLGPVLEDPPAVGAVEVRGDTVVAVSPLQELPGAGPALSLATSTSVSVVTPGRTPFVLAGLLVVAVALAVAGWLWWVLLAPVVGLTRAAERILDGDLDTPVPPGRGDETGRLAAALERCRVLLVRREVRAGRATRPPR